MRTKNPEYIAAIEKYISSYIDENGFSPSIQEIAAGTGMSQTNAHRYVSSMLESGILSEEGAHRSLTTRKDRETRQQTLRVPVLGRIACGIPKLAEENIEEYVRLPGSLFGKGDFFLLRANGDSMRNAGIEDGDLVLIRCQSSANRGEIVVALTGGEEATLKRFFPEPEKGIVRLCPENPSFEDIIVSDCVIQGVAVMVFKNLR